MQQKKNGLILLMMIIVMTIATACGNSSSEEANASNTDSQEATKLTFAAREGEMADAIKAVVPKYEEETGVEVEVVSMPFDQLKESVVLDIRNNGGAYDLTMIDDPYMPEFGEGDLLVKLDEYFPNGLDEDFLTQAVNLGKHPYESGELIALPLFGNVQLFYYRTDLLEKHNLDVPATWDDVVNIAETVVENEDNIYGYAVRGQRGNPIVSDYMPLFWAYGGTVLDENNQPQVNSEAGIKAMETYLKLKGLSPKGVESFNTDQIATSLTQGQVAMVIAWPSWVSQVDNEESSKVVGKVDLSAVPSQVSDSSAMIGNWMLGIPKSSQNVEPAVEFMKWITSPEIQKEMALDGGGAPTRISVYQDEELNEVYRHYPAQLEALQNSVARPRTPLWSQIEDTWGLYLSQILSGQLEVEEGLVKANEEIAKIMSK
ncbi:multiple sugar transport system substrate-binding protein [Gracilibacillus ureilyticus]|uniref:Multiple sugar transport system substrate-binding protein n=1 Tax=Gracilibacillus ureilyticus TaxID=531814 RepID=A0A1H9UTB8_9BACI|nr:extracellular solute-binding protein [Gracilibacillus ureilyticus]SES12656.1 multiple sugar transport system substrate-binding protein [Gracilibacillus ureilyticus]